MSEKRRYILIGFMSPEVIAGDACSIIPNVSIYEFVLLTLSVYMAWIRVVAGRLKCDIRCSLAVYNNMFGRIAESSQGEWCGSLRGI